MAHESLLFAKSVMKTRSCFSILLESFFQKTIEELRLALSPYSLPGEKGIAAQVFSSYVKSDLAKGLGTVASSS